jgi:hypothetical protein
MSPTVKLIAIAIGAAALVATPALASTFHKGWVLNRNDAVH